MKLIRNLFLLSIFFGCFTMQSQEKKEILKVHTFKDVAKIHQQKPKPIIVFLFTDWCKICFGMKKNTFQNDKVIKLLNDKFYFVKLNGEDKNDITFLDKTFVYKPSGNNTGTHELAKEIGSINGEISYPTTVFLNNKFEIDLQLNGFINGVKFYKLLNDYNKM